MKGPRRTGLAWLSALLLCTAGCVQPGAAPATFTQPRPGLYTGGQPTLRQLDSLSAQGVRTVIDLRPASEDHGFDEALALKERGLHYQRLPISGAKDLTAANASALKQLLQDSDGGVLLHCASGNRVGALLALMAVQEEQLPPSQALALGRQAGLKSLTPTVEQKLGLAPPHAAQASAPAR